MKSIETETTIDATRDKIWEILSDFTSYHAWNPFITGISGDIKPGARLSVILTAKGRKPRKVSPELISVTPGEKLCWKGKLLLKGLFNATHYFILEETEDGKSRFIHGENFRGILAGPLMIMLEKSTLDGFERMNKALMKLAENKDPAVSKNA